MNSPFTNFHLGWRESCQSNFGADSTIGPTLLGELQQLVYIKKIKLHRTVSAYALSTSTIG